MGLIEGLKDLIGILDDAQDYTDRVDKIMRPVKPLLKTLTGMTDKVKKDIDRISSSRDNDEVKRLFQRLDIDRPLLIGKSVLSKLVTARNELTDLARHLNKADSDFVSDVRPTIESAITKVTKALRENDEVIEKLSSLQEARKSAARAKAIIIGTTVAATAGTIAVGAVVGGMFSAISAIKTGLDSLTSFTDEVQTDYRSIKSGISKASQQARQQVRQQR